MLRQDGCCFTDGFASLFAVIGIHPLSGVHIMDASSLKCKGFVLGDGATFAHLLRGSIQKRLSGYDLNR